MVTEFQVLVGEQHLVIGNTIECEHGGLVNKNNNLFILKTKEKKNSGKSQDFQKQMSKMVRANAQMTCIP